MPAAEYVSPEGLRLDGRFVARLPQRPNYRMKSLCACIEYRSMPPFAHRRCRRRRCRRRCRRDGFIPLLPMMCRRPKELRQLRAELGVLSSATGSALFEMGNTKVLAAVFGPKPVEQRSQEDEKRAIIKCEYAMATFSTGKA
jgi:hypothetical protein